MPQRCKFTGALKCCALWDDVARICCRRGSGASFILRSGWSGLGFRWTRCLCSSNSNNDSSFCSASMWTTYILSGSQNPLTHCLIQILFVCLWCWGRVRAAHFGNSRHIRLGRSGCWQDTSRATLGPFKMKCERGSGRREEISYYERILGICCIPFTLEKFLIDMSTFFANSLLSPMPNHRSSTTFMIIFFCIHIPGHPFGWCDQIRGWKTCSKCSNRFTWLCSQSCMRCFQLNMKTIRTEHNPLRWIQW